MAEPEQGKKYSDSCQGNRKHSGNKTESKNRSGNHKGLGLSNIKLEGKAKAPGFNKKGLG